MAQNIKHSINISIWNVSSSKYESKTSDNKTLVSVNLQRIKAINVNRFNLQGYNNDNKIVGDTELSLAAKYRQVLSATGYNKSFRNNDIKAK